MSHEGKPFWAERTKERVFDLASFPGPFSFSAPRLLPSGNSLQTVNKLWSYQGGLVILSIVLESTRGPTAVIPFLRRSST